LTKKTNSIPEFKLRLVEEKDILLLYDMLKEMLATPSASVHEKPLPPFENSENFVKKYLFDNVNHDIYKWYMIIDETGKIFGSVKISKSNYVSYQIRKIYQNQGIGSMAVKKLMELNPRPRYFAGINEKNENSIRLIKKLGFKPKAIVFEKVDKQ